MNDVINFFQITDTIGTGGQPSVSQLYDIAQNGYDVVINLATHNSENAIENEGSVVASLGMTYIHIPVPFEAPTPEHLRKFFRFMNGLSEEKVFVHCAVNARVSAFVFKYLTMEKKIQAEKATTPLLEQWLPQMNLIWRNFLSLEKSDLD
tara:strand:- start:103 stop:552 length:450 start_codon:yes stop_codon:yes gene_type:complete